MNMIRRGIALLSLAFAAFSLSAADSRPIGVFDSGTGGLTVLEKMLTDDFAHERFVYLGDQANMPYGDYAAAGKSAFLTGLVIRDAEFLLSKNAKIIVIACNTATAYGYDSVAALLEKRGDGTKVIGVVNAGSRSAIRQLDLVKNPTPCAIGVLATPGTISSGVYERTIKAELKKLGVTAEVQVFSRGCAGLADAVEAGSPDAPKIACDNLKAMMAEHQAKAPHLPLRAVILGCTHFPFVQRELEAVAPKGVKFIDPAVDTAAECAAALKAQDRVTDRQGDISVETYVSVAAPGLDRTLVDEKGGLTRAWKYGRDFAATDRSTVPVTINEATQGDPLKFIPFAHMIPRVRKELVKARPLRVAVVDTCPTNDLVAVGRNYFDALAASGHIPFLLPRMESPEAIRAVLSKCDLVLFPGGADIEPKRYGEKPSPKLEYVAYKRDDFEYRVLDEVKKLRKPVFGICRGCQLINCYFGGTLVQDIPSEIGTSVAHRINKPRGGAAHAVRAEKGSKLAAVFGEDETRVVSWHHQSVGKLAPGFRVAARSADGVVEAIEGVDYPACGLQFHPEKTLRQEGLFPLKAIFDNLAALTGAEAAEVGTAEMPVVAIADYCSYFSNVCAKANLVEAQEKAGFASIVVPELPDASVDRLLAASDAVMIGGGLGKRQDYVRRCAFEDRVLALAIRRKLPIAGICHGSQIINRYLGGELSATSAKSPILHRNTSVTNMNENLHRTVNVPGSLMARVMGEGECTINSSHSKRSEIPAPGIRVTSRAADGVIEAFEHETLPIKAFQFHPERLWKLDPRALDLIRGSLVK